MKSIKMLNERMLLHQNKAAALLLGVYLLVGLFIFDDYGISFDEPWEKDTTLVTAGFLMEYAYTNIPQVFGFLSEDLRYKLSEQVGENDFSESLDSYYSKYYGATLNLPTIALEILLDLDESTAYKVRHLYNFLIFWLACLCFYLTLKLRFTINCIPLAGLLMLILSPRFFTEAFYNNKDLMFVSLVIIAGYFAFKLLEKCSLGRIIVFSAAAALASTVRITGICLPVLVAVFIILKVLRKEISVLKSVIYSAFVIVFFFVCYVVFFPASWSNPVGFMIETFTHFMHFQPWYGTHLYLGNMITRDVPWHYIPVWIFVTTPVLYSLLFLYGSFHIVHGIIKNKLSQLTCHNKDVYYDSFMFVLFYANLIGYIVLSVDMYEGWRHAYTLYPAFIYIAVLGLNLCNCFKTVKVIRVKNAIVVSSFLFTFIWMIYCHPFQYVYFNVFTRPFVEGNFEKDYWYVSNRQAAEYILENDSRNPISVKYTGRLLEILPPDQRDRLIRENDNPDYIIASTKDVIGEDYIKLYDVKAGSIVVSSIYKQR